MYSEFSLVCIPKWIVFILYKPFQIQICVWRWLFESLYKRTRREISLWQTWLWILWYSHTTCCQNRGSQISITLQGKKKFYDSYHVFIKFKFLLIYLLMHTYVLDVLWCQPIKLMIVLNKILKIEIFWGHEVLKLHF